MRILNIENLQQFHAYLLREEKSKATTEKYLRDLNTFMHWKIQNCITEIDKGAVLSYKEYLCENYAVSSVNSMLSSLNSFFDFCEWYELKVKTVKLQRRIFSSREKELTRAEYTRLLRTAKDKNNQRLYLLLQTICSTGIRVSELRFVTVQSLCRGYVSEKKVFPHNLRHLFARTYYSIQKDIVRLADLLGHASVNTTRIYTMESGEVHRRQIQKLGLLRC